MNDFNDLNSQTFGSGGQNPPYDPTQPNYFTYIPYGFTPKTFEEKTKIKKIANIIGGSLLALNVIVAFFPFITSFIFSLTGMNIDEIYKVLNDPAFNQFYQIIGSFVMFTLPFIIFFKVAGYRISDLAIFSKPKKKSFLPLFLMGIAFCAFANIAVSIAGNIFSAFGINYEVDARENPQGILGFALTFISTAVVPPLVEEFACRGLILGSLRKFGDGFAIIVSSVIFGLMHGNFQQIPFAFLVGLVLGYITVKSGSLWIAVAVHAFNNFIKVFFDYLPETLPVMAQNVMYMVLLAVIMILGIVSLVMLRKNGEEYQIEKSNTESTNSQKVRWFFSSVTIIIFVVLSFIESLAYFK